MVVKKSFKEIFKRNLLAYTAIGLLVSCLLIGLFVAVPPTMVLIPVLPILFTTIKSVIDYRTRKDIDEKVLKNTKTKIKELDSLAKLKPLLIEISSAPTALYSTSHSSYIFKDRIRDKIDAQVKFEIALLRAEKVNELKKAQFTAKNPKSAEILINAGMNQLWRYEKLTEESRVQLNEYTAEEIVKSEAKAVTLYQAEIVNFIEAKHNAGKKTVHLVCNFFKPKPVVPNTDLVIDTNVPSQ